MKGLLSLTEALKRIGITHKASPTIEGKRDWFDGDGNHIGTYCAAEGWEQYEKHARQIEDRWREQRGRSHKYGGLS